VSESYNGRWLVPIPFSVKLVDEDGTGNYFETDKAETDTPTTSIDSEYKMRVGKINRVHWRLNPTNAVTYDLYIFGDALAADYASQAEKLFDSNDVVADCADDTEYDATGLDIPFRLRTPGEWWYNTDWSGAPGNTTGYLCIEGVYVY